MIWLRYVPHGELLRYLVAGWTLDDELHFTSHGEYAVLMRWPEEGDPPEVRANAEDQRR